jgi:hypothetical protein
MSDQSIAANPGDFKPEGAIKLAENALVAFPADFSTPAMEELAQVAQWVCYRLRRRDGQDKPTKVPYQVDGRPASSTDPETWTSFEAVRQRMAGPRPPDGIGWVVREENGLVLVDLDGCRNPETGEIAAWALKIVRAFNSYTEISPSGTGLHIYVRGTIPDDGRKVGNAEAYKAARFFTVTGQHYPESPDEIVENQEAIDWFWRTYITKGKPEHKPNGSAVNGHAGNGHDTSGLDLSTAVDPEHLKELTSELCRENQQFADALAYKRRDLLKPDGSPDYSAHDMALATYASWAGWPASYVQELVRQARAGSDEPAKGRRQDYLERTVKRAMADVARAKAERQRAREEHQGQATARRLRIRVQGGQLHDQVEQASTVLVELTHRDPLAGIYVQNARLARTVLTKSSSSTLQLQRPDDALAIDAVSLAYARGVLTREADWEKFDARKGKWVPIDAHSDTVETLLASRPWPGVPVLRGVVAAPTIRPDGTLLDRPGYDQATGVLFNPAGAVFPAIPERPTKADAARALARLRKVLSGFPFTGEPDEAAALSGIMTAVYRKAMRTAPLHCVTAPKMGSGKTLLAVLSGLIATGVEPYIISHVEDEAAIRKLIVSTLADGAQVVVIDNIEYPLKSSSLCSVLTSPVYRDRTLGVTGMTSVETSSTLFATGNNLVIRGDLSSRVLMCEIDPRCEHPEEREFGGDLLSEVRANRAELVAAVLTIVLAYIAAGEPKQDIPPFGRFEDWSRFVRSPLVWLGMSDPCVTRQRVETGDEDRTGLGALLEAWHALLGERKATVRQALGSRYQEANSEARAALGRAALEVTEGDDGKTFNYRKLGWYISGRAKRVERGLRFEQVGEQHGDKVWRVIRVGQ